MTTPAVRSQRGDVDGDGLDDLLVGAYGRDEGGSSAGKTYLILGASLGANPTIDLSAADYAFIGEAAGDNSGRSVSSAGDVDGDGLDDLLVGLTSTTRAAMLRARPTSSWALPWARAPPSTSRRRITPSSVSRRVTALAIRSQRGRCGRRRPR